MAEIFDENRSIKQFLDATAAKQPAPGGGSVAALVGALGVAVGQMVVNYSIGRKDMTKEDDAILREALSELQRARAALVELMIEDQSAFNALSTARKNAGGAGDKDPAFAAALLACIRIPQAIAGIGGAILELCERLLPLANKYLLSDLAVCAELSMATVRCAAYNVYVNLADISDPAERQRFDQATADLLAHATTRIRALVPVVRAKL